MANKADRPASSHSSDKEGESFEDASEISPRPDSHSEKSRSRSLLGRRGSSSSTVHEGSPDSPAPVLPKVPKEANGDTEALENDSDDVPSTKSPLLTAHRISVTSDMDDVSLDEEGAKAPGLLPKLPPRESRDSTSALQGLSGRMSPVKFPVPPPAPPVQEKSTPVPQTSRKLTGPFAWLSRHSSSKKPETSPPPVADRRHTNASINTLGSNPELTLSRIEDEGDLRSNNRSSQGSLRDRFKFLRMREEAGITLEDETSTEPGSGGAMAGLVGRTTSVGLGIGSPTSIAEDEHGPTSPPALVKQPTINPNLAPGTASGFAAGPAGDTAEPVDWDLWQTVVNEGPAALARTSSEELNRAISNGIPQVIRGVIWQVLAQSKSEELETKYRELVARGTDKEHISVRTPNLSNGHVNGNGKEKESVASSSSSVHSDYSTPATTTASTNAPLHSPSIASETSEDPIKLQARLAAEKKLTAATISKLEKTIKRDLGARTSYSKYVMAAGLQDGLFGICKAYALYDEAVGYAQGMNFIAMPLLFNMPEEEAFSLFVTLMNKYNLRDLFVHDMPGLHLHLYQFERLLEEFEPALYCHLRRREVKPQLYATQWFLTLFAYRFPLQLVLRIYDLILSEGLESAILKFGIVLMQKNAEALLAMKDMATLTTFLKERIFDVYIDKAPTANSILENGFFGSTAGIDKEVYRADILVKDAVAVKITPDMLKQYTAEWKEQQRIEKERESELHGLKDKVTALESKVRLLETRAEQSDMEHVQVASELIKTKVENESLAEENETLKTKVEELQKIVDTQPDEVEARLKGEMETVMQKNITVHNENRALEDAMADMEKELVATKMQWATINEEHESLKQKWHSVSQMMKK
ncbi:GTPase-activating protein-like protein GYP5 [Cucurbitaria berberidis CBS 394.84]|uniref:GTPase-activating protein GYP5 n=1 Tax=Cucurbitaria berberidis CBS 394.84 TaxID=1168544 RepID=A0A9P4LER3_9PLEO|nr:GTPase-activating protein-like protein GYP5 [Cucurbitaria berberidis CBS 394.84]KAF1852203.1 GTPase-activating protein-like protein GYP5 [Cucurbitaria berberidis CBS 394.84]